MGGGLKEFVFEDQEYFEGVEDSTTFLNSQERQSIVKNMLFNLRATESDQLGNIRFLDGQALGKSSLIIPYFYLSPSLRCVGRLNPIRILLGIF